MRKICLFSFCTFCSFHRAGSSGPQAGISGPPDISGQISGPLDISDQISGPNFRTMSRDLPRNFRTPRSDPDAPGSSLDMVRNFGLEILAGNIRGSGNSGLRTGTSGPVKTAENAKRKRTYLSHPDSVFDDLGLVEIVTTSSTRIYKETSQSNKGG